MRFVGLIQKKTNKKADAKPRKSRRGTVKAESGDESDK